MTDRYRGPMTIDGDLVDILADDIYKEAIEAGRQARRDGVSEDEAPYTSRDWRRAWGFGWTDEDAAIFVAEEEEREKIIIAEGAKARREELERASCPYADERKDSWLSGWEAEHKEILKAADEKTINAEGAEAFRKGLDGEDDNPYSIPPLSDWWEEGWIAAADKAAGLEGKAARYQGLKPADCPYKGWKKESWMSGWCEADGVEAKRRGAPCPSACAEGSLREDWKNGFDGYEQYV